MTIDQLIKIVPVPNFTADEFHQASNGLFLYKPDHGLHLVRLLLWLAAIRKIYGSPLKITSAYRSPSRNVDVGGVATSRHLDGLALDIVPVGEGRTSDDWTGPVSYLHLVAHQTRLHHDYQVAPFYRTHVHIEIDPQRKGGD